MVERTEQRVRVRRQVDPDDLGLLVDHVIDEAGVLVRETVVVLAPHVRGQQDVERGDRPSPGDLVGHLEPLGVLVEHRIDDVDERLVAVEQPVASGQEVALEPALALVLGEHLHDATGRCQVLVDRPYRGVPLLVGHVQDRAQAVRGGLVGSEDPERLGVQLDDAAEPLAEHPGGLGHGGAGGLHRYAAVPEVRQPQVPQALTAVGTRVVAHPQGALGGELAEPGAQRSGLVEQLVRPVGAEPGVEDRKVLGGVPGVRERYLMAPPGVLDLHAINRVRPGPALRGAHDDHRPGRATPEGARRGRCLDLGDLVEHLVERCGEAGVHRHRVLAVEAAGDHVRRVAVPAHQVEKLRLRDPGEHGRVRDLVAVEVQDRQHDAVGQRIDELVRVPAGRERSGLGLAVADHCGDQEVRVVERRAVRVREGVAELAALVDRSWRLRGDVARDPAREGELPEQTPHPFEVRRDVGVDLRVGPLQVGIRDQAWSTVTGAGDVDGREGPLDDRAVQVGVDEVQAGRRPEVAEQPWLDVVAGERLAEKWVGEKVDLPDREVVRGAPPTVDTGEGVTVQRGDVSGLPGVRPRGGGAHGGLLDAVRRWPGGASGTASMPRAGLSGRPLSYNRIPSLGARGTSGDLATEPALLRSVSRHRSGCRASTARMGRTMSLSSMRASLRETWRRGSPGVVDPAERDSVVAAAVTDQYVILALVMTLAYEAFYLLYDPLRLAPVLVLNGLIGVAYSSAFLIGRAGHQRAASLVALLGPLVQFTIVSSGPSRATRLAAR